MSTQILAQLRQLKLGGMAHALQTQLEQTGTYEALPFVERLSLLIELVQRHNNAAAIGASLDEDAALLRAAALVRGRKSFARITNHPTVALFCRCAQVRKMAPRAASHAVVRARSQHNPRYNAWFRSVHGNQSGVELEWLIREGARGLFVDETSDRQHLAVGRIGTSPCTMARLVAPHSRCRGQCALRAMLLSRVWKFDPSLDAVNAHLLARLHELAAKDSRVAGFDTVTLWQPGFRDRPDNGSPAELWDVRYLQTPKASRAKCTDGGCAHPPRHFGRLDGSPCELDPRTPRCWACNNSRLSRGCSGKTPSDPVKLRC